MNLQTLCRISGIIIMPSATLNGGFRLHEWDKRLLLISRYVLETRDERQTAANMQTASPTKALRK